ncbi:MAG: putative sulfate exporter family transporter [Candidatus Limnocylindrales bacterium]
MCLAVALAARWLAGSMGLGIETALALILGLALGSVPAIRTLALPGARVAARQLLRIGVALLGARLTLAAVVQGGAAALLGATVIVLVGLGLGLWLARRLALPGRLGWLIAAGMAICGNSAILALAPILRAEDRETTYAVSTITIFGLVGVLALPVLGHALGMADGAFGTWAGLSVNDTAQVVATGYAYSPPAGDVATIVKLTRNLAIAPVLLGAALLVPGARATSTRLAVVRAVPWFVLGFVVLAALRSVGVLDGIVPWGGTVADTLSGAATWLILVALAGVGASADLRATVGIGPRPFVLGIVLWVVILALGFALAATLGGAVYDGR